MPDIRRLNDRFAVAPQIAVADLPAIAAAGFVAIVNNRPDDEDAGQPLGDSIRAAAEAAGLAYFSIPVTHAGFSHPQIDAMTTALVESKGPVLAYCRSGTRSATAWALGQAGDRPADEILTAGRNAGYDLSHLAPMLRG